MSSMFAVPPEDPYSVPAAAYGGTLPAPVSAITRILPEAGPANDVLHM